MRECGPLIPLVLDVSAPFSYSSYFAIVWIGVSTLFFSSVSAALAVLPNFLILNNNSAYQLKENHAGQRIRIQPQLVFGSPFLGKASRLLCCSLVLTVRFVSLAVNYELCAFAIPNVITHSYSCLNSKKTLSLRVFESNTERISCACA